MGEASRRSQEPRGQRGDRGQGQGGRLAQGGEQDPLHPPYVDQIEGERAGAGLFQAGGAVLLAQAQQFLGLSEFGPGELPGEEFFGEAADAFPELARLGDHVVGIPAGVGAAILRVVVVVGGTSAGRLRRVDLDQLAAEEDAYQGAIAADDDRLAPVRRGHRVEGAAELDMMIGMNAALGPLRRVEPIAGEGPQRDALFFLEDRQRPAARGAVDAGAGDLLAPADGLALDVLDVEEALAAEEVLPHVGNLSLDVRLAGGVVGGGRVDHEAPVLGVLGKGALEDGLIAVRLGDRGLEVVHDGAGGDAAKELPGGFQAVDHVGYPLAARHVNVHVTAVDEHDDQGPQQVPPAGLRIEEVAETPEVDLGQFARPTRGAAHGHAPPAELTVRDGEAVQRAVGNDDALARQETLNLGEPQAALVLGSGEPPLDLLPVTEQQPFGLSGPDVLRTRPHALEDARSEPLVGLTRSGLPAQLAGVPLIATDRLASQARCPRHTDLALAAPEAAESLENFPHAVLLISHHALLCWRQ